MAERPYTLLSCGMSIDGYVDDLKMGEGPSHNPYSEPVLNQSHEEESKEEESGEKVGADNYVEVLPEKKTKKAKKRRELPVVEEESKEHESGEKSHPDVAKHKGSSCAATDDESCNRHLVWCDSRFAKERDYRGFDWRVDVSGKVQCALLRRI